MKRLSLFLVGILVSLTYLVKADEGMWLPILIERNMATMTEKGLQLTAEDIYSINHSSIKDAIIALDHGSCTGELISGEGLVITNHHCGYGEIQSHSSVEHDYLTNGFWAMSKKEELANPGKTASFLIRVEEVTERIMNAIPAGTDQATRNHIADSISQLITDEATHGTQYDASVEEMFAGNYYYLFVYETFRDIRLVGTPPESIGKFGSDTDNWMWPRHTGDFSMFRIYCGPDGKPADYAEANVPFKPKHFLPISLDGFKKDDFAFIMGYPGNTQRYMTSFELKNVIDFENPNRVRIRGIKQDIWMEDMEKSDKVRIQYASKYARSSNYWKYSLEQNKALKRLNVLEQKKALEAEFSAWVNQNEARKAKYGKALSLIEISENEVVEIRNAQQYMYETMIGGAESFIFAFRASGLMMALATPDSVDLIKKQTMGYQKRAIDFYQDYNAATDLKATKALIKLFIAGVPAKFYPDFIPNVLNKKYKGDVDKFVDDLFKKSMFVDSTKLIAFLAKPNAKTLGKDPIFMTAGSIITTMNSYYGMTQQSNLKYQEGMRLFEGGLLEMNPEKAYAPDANSTMRLTYGTVGDYVPADAVYYNYFTTLEGVMQKEDPDVREFNVPAKLKEIYKNKDYGRYGNPDGTMTVCFTTNNDITGGNSGSPVINGKGHLMGLAFDGNSEAMSGDIAFENNMQKCINVDIRYVLLIIDKFAGAQNLIDEMNLVKTEPKPALPIAEPVMN
ncbi:MAG TPA: serine protease [Marinilabiliales bacterium]|nr:MAG: peptidase S46 [Bacteroidetes bacterium GWA2_40_14]OFX56990.1 MAG: peptidase S46 [Bacteroidetes bacterium GWC2_40_13]OFX74863.1 MAG: peptidase S46 [Bacteroidetes bacterium GWD2_40_43]OFX93406.1 MAG: peptidase S46 [Bacteroidetes bacterium GWE2_40_63]OFY18419.1 MAG: peptidase S46 [Bacteroidetes bacterium GWF2_40_13]OFZ26454.1 MAG: peptidase S46 [Bacteroidetes bacterium RIFOXYC2_FULL_40_12]HAM97136.1 serine protease [Marinilabiliales bacterium]